jgi:hypothetical protein
LVIHLREQRRRRKESFVLCRMRMNKRVEKDIQYGNENEKRKTSPSRIIQHLLPLPLTSLSELQLFVIEARQDISKVSLVFCTILKKAKKDKQHMS